MSFFSLLHPIIHNCLICLLKVAWHGRKDFSTPTAGQTLQQINCVSLLQGNKNGEKSKKIFVRLDGTIVAPSLGFQDSSLRFNRVSTA